MRRQFAKRPLNARRERLTLRVHHLASWVILASPWVGTTIMRAQSTSLPPVRMLGPRLATLADSPGEILDIRALSDGRVLVNDVRDRDVRLYDSTLQQATVVIGLGASSGRAYGSGSYGSGGRGALVAGTGDTTIFVDPVARSLFLIAPSGTVSGPVMPPQPADVGSFVSSPVGAGAYPVNAAVDATGRLLYEATGRQFGANGLTIPGRVGSGILSSARVCDGLNCTIQLPPFLRDSDPLLRANLSTRRIDTAGYLRVQRPSPPMMINGADGQPGLLFTAHLYNPLLQDDDWAVLADGSIAFVRAQDHHIDWIDPDGSRRSTPPMPHDWPRLADSAKAAIVDSATRAYRINQDALTARSVGQQRQGGGAAGSALPTIILGLPAAALPDYLEPFGMIVADANDDLWIAEPTTPLGVTGCVPARGSLSCTSTTPRDPLIFDVVNREGHVVDRIQLPPLLTPIGFGPGVVYLVDRTHTMLAKYRIR